MLWWFTQLVIRDSRMDHEFWPSFWRGLDVPLPWHIKCVDSNKNNHRIDGPEPIWTLFGLQHLLLCRSWYFFDDLFLSLFLLWLCGLMGLQNPSIKGWPTPKPLSVSLAIPPPWWLVQGGIWDPIRPMKHHPGKRQGTAISILLNPSDREWGLLDTTTWTLNMKLTLPMASWAMEGNQSLKIPFEPCI